MATLDDPMSQVTRLSNLAFVDDTDNRYRALNTPILSQQEIIDIPVTENLVGGIVFNRDTEELETYTAAGFWLPILTAESDINVETLTAQTVNAIDADLTHIHSNDITNDAVITTLGLLTMGDAQVNGTLHVQTNFQVDGTSSLTNGNVSGNLTVSGNLHSSDINNDDLITTLGLHVTSNAKIDGNMLCKTGGVTGDMGVNGNLVGGNLSTIGNLLVDGNSTLQNVTINGDLNVTGVSTLQRISSPIIDVNDFEASTNRVDGLLYGLTNFGGGAPVVATLDVGAGTGATYSMSGSNLAGKFTLTTGSSPTLGIIATFTLPSYLNTLMTGQGCMIMTPASATTAIYEKNSKTYVSCSTGNVIAIFGSSQTALTASTTYVWNYMIMGNILGT